MAGFSNYFEQKCFELLTKTGASFSVPANQYISLHHIDPTEAMNAGEMQTVGTGSDSYSPGYVRKSYAADANTSTHTQWTNPSGGGSISNVAQITFAAATGDWNQPVSGGAGRNIGFWGSFDAVSAGNGLFYGTITTPRTVSNGAQAYFAASALTLSLD